MPRFAVPYTVAPTRTRPAGAGTLYLVADDAADALERARTIHEGRTFHDYYRPRKAVSLTQTERARITYRTPVQTEADPVAERQAAGTAAATARSKADAKAWVSRVASGAAVACVPFVALLLAAAWAGPGVLAP